MADGVPPVPSLLAKVDAKALGTGVGAPTDDPIVVCTVPKKQKWTLKVKVHSQETYWPKKRVQISIAGIEGTSDGESKGVRMKSADSIARSFEGHGKKDFDVTASIKHWEVVAVKKAHMQDGKTESVTVDIKARPWIAFKVIDEKTSKEVKAVTLKTDLPGPGKKDTDAPEGTAQVNDLDDGGTGAYEAIEHAEVWIYVKSSTSPEPIE
jgi:hypothetical protein